MSKKSSKTAHVLNLISPAKTDTSSAPDEDNVSSEVKGQKQRKKTEEVIAANKTDIQETPLEVQPSEKKSKSETMESILHLSESTENISELIKGNLEKELFAELSSRMVESTSDLPSEALHPTIKAHTPEDIVEVINAPSDIGKSYDSVKSIEETLTIEIEHAIAEKNPIGVLEKQAGKTEEPLTDTKLELSPILEPDIQPEVVTNSQPEEKSLETQLSALVSSLAEAETTKPEEHISANDFPMSETDEPTEDIGANTLPLYESVQSPSDIHPNTSETTEPAIDIQSDVLPPSEATQPISDFSSDALPQPETANPELDIFDTLPEKEHIDEAAINSADVVNPGSLPISEFAEPSTIKYIDESGNKLYYTNVYETIVKACIYEYLQKFQVCTCSHCLADATALALTNLPSKYVVTDSPDVGSVINYIEQNEMASIMTEVTKACFEIDAKPRH